MVTTEGSECDRYVRNVTQPQQCDVLTVMHCCRVSGKTLTDETTAETSPC